MIGKKEQRGQTDRRRGRRGQSQLGNERRRAARLRSRMIKTACCLSQCQGGVGARVGMFELFCGVLLTLRGMRREPSDEEESNTHTNESLHCFSINQITEALHHGMKRVEYQEQTHINTGSRTQTEWHDGELSEEGRVVGDVRHSNGQTSLLPSRGRQGQRLNHTLPLCRRGSSLN